MKEKSRFDNEAEISLLMGELRGDPNVIQAISEAKQDVIKALMYPPELIAEEDKDSIGKLASKIEKKDHVDIVKALRRKFYSKLIEISENFKLAPGST